MTRRSGMILGLAVAALAAGVAMTTVGRSSRHAGPGASSEPQASAAGANRVADDVAERGSDAASGPADGTEAHAADLSGLWRFDPAHSDMPRWGERGPGAGGRSGGPGFGQGPNGSERHGGERRGSGAPGGAAPGRDGGPRGRLGGRMPSLIEIHQDTGAVTLADSTGQPFVEIRFDGVAPQTGGTTEDKGPRVVAGHWHDGVLQFEREGRNGMKAVQSFALEDHGRTLVVHSQMSSDGERPAREFKRVYRRVTGS
jgi:hypothetical protein